MKNNLIGKVYIQGGKKYKFVQELNIEGNPCHGCVFDYDVEGNSPSGCEDNPSRDNNYGDCMNGVVIIRNTKQGLADYIAKRMGA